MKMKCASCEGSGQWKNMLDEYEMCPDCYGMGELNISFPSPAQIAIDPTDGSTIPVPDVAGVWNRIVQEDREANDQA